MTDRPTGTPSDEELRLRTATLLEKLSREDVAPATAGSHLVGRLSAVSSALEKLLGAAVRYAAECDGRQPEDFLRPVNGQTPRFDRAMQGQLAHGTRNYFRNRAPSSVPKPLGPIVADLVQQRSKIISFIEVRNSVVKEGADPALGRAASADLKLLIDEFRRQAGWE